MEKIQATDECFQHLLGVLKCLECFITDSVKHGLGFFICFMIQRYKCGKKANESPFLYVLYSDKTWVFD